MQLFEKTSGNKGRDDLKEAFIAQHGRHVLIIVVVLAILVRVGFVLITGPIIAQDTGEYTLLAHNILTAGEFARADTVTGEWLPYAFRMPLYQSVLAVIFALFGETRAADWATVLLQALLSAATAGLIVVMGYRVSGWSLGLLAGLLFVLDPVSILSSAYVLTDTLFAFLTILGLLAGMLALHRQNHWLFLLWGLAIGVATLTRPLLKFYVIVPLLTIVTARWPMRVVLRCGLACVVGCSLVLGPWVVRNKIQLDFWGLELNQGVNTLWSTMHLTQPSSPADYAADPELATARDIIVSANHPLEALDAVKRNMGVSEPEANQYLQQVGTENVLRNPAAFLVIMSKNAINVMTGPATIQRTLYHTGLADKSVVSTTLSTAIEQRMMLQVLANLVPRILSFVVLFVGATLGWVMLWRTHKQRQQLILFALTCVYIVGLTSMVAGHDRYRLPIEGILLITVAALVIEFAKLCCKGQEKEL
jgi:4-amino-4-deoxy-L-arabinose transferase-like glycosyltransferase